MLLTVARHPRKVGNPWSLVLYVRNNKGVDGMYNRVLGTCPGETSSTRKNRLSNAGWSTETGFIFIFTVLWYYTRSAPPPGMKPGCYGISINWQPPTKLTWIALRLRLINPLEMYYDAFCFTYHSSSNCLIHEYYVIERMVHPSLCLMN
jgi:hypothetical protein